MVTGRRKTDFSKIDTSNISPVYKRGKVLFTYTRDYDPPSGQNEEKDSSLIFVKAVEINTRKENSITSDPYSEDSSIQSLSAGIAALTPLTLLLKNKEQKPCEGDEILMSLTVTEDVRYYNADGYCESVVKKSTSDFSIKRIFGTLEVGIKKVFENIPIFSFSESGQVERSSDIDYEDEILLSKILIDGPSRVTSVYGKRISPISGKEVFHDGIDFGAKVGTIIRSMAAGEVVIAREQYDFGWNVRIRHEDNKISLYAHASELLVSQGDFVQANQPIAKIGSTGRSTGPHLHLELHEYIGNKRKRINPTIGLDLYGLR